MCDQNILAHSDHGYIVLCTGCGHYQLAFGTSAIAFEPGQFAGFCRQLQHINDTICCNGFEKQKRITLDLPDENIKIILNYRELRALYALVEEAVHAMQLEMVMDELNISRS